MHPGFSAYLKTQSLALKGQLVESEALLKAARLLETARISPSDPGVLGTALKFNLTLWTFFQADLMEPANALSEKLKSELLDLSLYMDRSSVELLQGYDANTLETMITINRNLAGAMLEK